MILEGGKMRYRYKFMRFPEGKEKAVTASYDDNLVQDKRLSDIFTKYGIKCTFNLNSAELRGDDGLTKEEVQKYILDRGHEIAVHGHSHRAPGTTRPVEGIREILDLRVELEKRYGIIIRGMAYPDCGVRLLSHDVKYDDVKQYLSHLDIAYSRTTKCKDEFTLPEDWYNWSPTVHHNHPEIMEYIDRFLDIKLTDMEYYCSGDPRVFYFWGHSYEFDNDNNWDHIENVCEKLSGKDDIWYATNYEIYEYTHAYDSLIYSADGLIVHNPTAIDVWFCVDGFCEGGKVYSVKAGETINIEE